VVYLLLLSRPALNVIARKWDDEIVVPIGSQVVQSNKEPFVFELESNAGVQILNGSLPTILSIKPPIALVTKPLSRVSMPLKNKNNKSALALPLTKALQQAYLWLGVEIVSFFEHINLRF